jgi:adenosine deaminase
MINNESRSNNLKLEIEKLSKTELHLHLEGAIPVETLYKLVQRSSSATSITTIEELISKMKYKNFSHFIEVWVWKNSFITKESDFFMITLSVLEALSQQNITDAELFYSPGDFWRQKLSIRGITEEALAGRQKAFEEFGIRSEFIVDLVRDFGPELGRITLDEVTPYLGKGIIGIGLGGSEQAFPAGDYESVFAEAKDRGFHLTAHAGEAAGPESIWETITKLNVERIGHGIRAIEDPGLMAYLKERQIPLEICPVSNVRTGVVKELNKHPVRRMFDEGLFVTVNSDDPVMFNTSLNYEFQQLAEHLSFDLEEIKTVLNNAHECLFKRI